jgi:hypothetical protein
VLASYLDGHGDNPYIYNPKRPQKAFVSPRSLETASNIVRTRKLNDPDAVIADSNIWAGGWAEGRAKAYGVTVAELPAYYAKRTLLNESILPDDIANACFAFVGGLLNKSTGNALNVDGGVAAGFLR